MSEEERARRDYWREFSQDVFKNVVSAAVIAGLGYVIAALFGYVEDPEARVIVVASLVATTLWGIMSYLIVEAMRRYGSSRLVGYSIIGGLAASLVALLVLLTTALSA